MTLQDQITAWIKNYAHTANMKSLVVGISGGIDSAVKIGRASCRERV